MNRRSFIAKLTAFVGAAAAVPIAASRVGLRGGHDVTLAGGTMTFGDGTTVDVPAGTSITEVQADELVRAVELPLGKRPDYEAPSVNPYDGQ